MEQKNILLSGFAGKPMLTDIFYENDGTKKPVIIYAHGFNGFKDWGNFDLIARQFAKSGFVFVKFNFSHNGTTAAHPEDFENLEAYGNDNYTQELDDLKTVIDWAVSSSNPHAAQINTNKIFLLGHSKGGGIVLLKAAEDKRVKAVATWASVAECKTPWGNWSQEKMETWKATGVQYITNSRTKQELPLYYQLFENYVANKERLDIEKAIGELKIPVLLCHGSEDTSVLMECSKMLEKWQPEATLFVVESDHVFGRKHPWAEKILPEPMQQVLDRTITFFKKLEKK